MLLRIGVAASSTRYDRATKVPRYAQASIPDVRLVRVPDEQIERYAQPVNGSYQTIYII